uniref:Uncharacterized protein n=1 Tax=Siphoviridae sp. ctxjx4 TaxID=2826522 RepID=A0A8S5M209_9CAUD|nr:MAG TPA: hypothetical protein [Siphoviridae sp. ctxjx4]
MIFSKKVCIIYTKREYRHLYVYLTFTYILTYNKPIRRTEI